MFTRTVGLRDLERELRRSRRDGCGIAASNSDDDLPKKPTTRAGCADVPRPCPFASCRYNLLLDVNSSGGIRYTRMAFVADADSCALDVAEKGPQSYQAVGRLLHEEGESVRIIAKKGFEKLKAKASLQDLAQ